MLVQQQAPLPFSTATGPKTPPCAPSVTRGCATCLLTVVLALLAGCHAGAPDAAGTPAVAPTRGAPSVSGASPPATSTGVPAPLAATSVRSVRFTGPGVDRFGAASVTRAYRTVTGLAARAARDPRLLSDPDAPDSAFAYVGTFMTRGELARWTGWVARRNDLRDPDKPGLRVTLLAPFVTKQRTDYVPRAPYSRLGSVAAADSRADVDANGRLAISTVVRSDLLYTRGPNRRRVSLPWTQKVTWKLRLQPGGAWLVDGYVGTAGGGKERLDP